jgi:hypothetical protein
MERFKKWAKLLLFCIGLVLCLVKSAYPLDVTLQWDANTETDLAGYRVYYRTGSSGGGVLGNYDGTGANEGDSPIEMLLAEGENADADIVECTVTGLPNGQTYYFVVTAYDNEVPSLESNASNEVDTGSSSPDTTPPVISDVQVASTTETTTVIHWTTNEISDSQVQYGEASSNWDSYPFSCSETSRVISHSITLTGLSDNTTYYFRVGSSDVSGNGPTISSEGNFGTENTSPNATIIFGDVPDADNTDSCEDTFVNAGQPSLNYASDSSLNTYTWPTDTVANRAIMKWDLSSIPSNAIIQSATLSVYMYGVEGTGGDDNYEISAHKIVNKNPVISSCTWNTSDGITSWTGGSDGGAQDLAASESTVSVDKKAGYKTWNITQMVQEWVNNPATNFGLMLNSDSTAASDSSRYFRSTEYFNPDERPKLTIVYSCTVCPTGLRIGRR